MHMLDWIKRIKSPPATVQVVEPPEAPAEKDERLERLLIRLGSDRSAKAEATEDVRAEAAPGIEPDSRTDASASPVVAVAEPPVSAAPVDVPVVDSDLAAEISAAIDSLDKEGESGSFRGLGELSTAEDSLATEEEVELDSSLETGPILGAIAPPEAEGVAELRAGLSARRTVPRIVGATSQMKIIAVCSQKGGSGKTTIAGHLAVQAGLSGQGPAVLIDTDPQGSLAEWWRVRKDDAPALAKVRLEELEDNLDELRSYGTTACIIDTPPALTGSIEQVMGIADLIVIPARPSPHDLRAVGATVAMCKRAGKPFLFVLNGAAQRANITVQAVAALSEHGRVSPVILYQRTEYAASMIDGRTVIEAAPSGKSAQEVAELWKFVYAQVGLRAAA